ncbi:GTPase [Marinobacter bryozoorum]|uniref:GTPase n=1 Tax=Marinobacter bryozoorum TaxID=256324 RepID=UPI002003294B|nr:GTPase [Marinobacter bryozoorum]MCK7544411.1 GTPase [Marinobacter bryozoorum]
MQKPDLTVPEPRIAHLSFCEATPKAFRYWVEHLPMANLGELSRQLYHAIIELNQLFCPPAQRLQFLELIRPRIRFVCTELSRHYLGMAIALPEKQRKIANLSQALQLHLASGYKLTIMEMLDAGTIDRQRKPLAQCCHRALTEIGATTLRAFQLYTASPAGSWHESHQLYRFARHHNLHEQRVQDSQRPQRPESSIADAYCHTLLLGCARANQLRQSELEQVSELLELWAPRVQCAPGLATSAVFLVDTDSDKPPCYRSLAPAADSEHWWGFDTGALAEQIQEHLSQPPQPATARQAGGKSAPPASDLPLTPRISESLLNHLGQALALLTQRNFNRLEADGQLEICAGLTAVHYFLAGQKPFAEFVMDSAVAGKPERNNRFMKPVRKDAWSDAFDAGISDERIRPHADTPINYQKAGVESDNPQPRNQPRSYRTRVVNTSPGGYCVVWSADMPPTLQAGEILGVREHRNHPWSIALVRWLRQNRGEGTRIGIEVIAPGATPCGVQLIQKTGNSSEFLRGLLLPEIPGAHLPENLVTPTLPFQSGSRITLMHQDTQTQGLLGRKIAATGSISQFELRLYKRPDEPDPGPGIRQVSPGASDSDFDSLWPDL